MTYQSIDGPGSSQSAAKLNALSFPAMSGKTFLDVGCNEGFFCGAAVASGATRALGIDASEEFIKNAKARFPKAEFLCIDWTAFFAANTERFDYILCASALHYANDQSSFIRTLLSHLTQYGRLILECGIAETDEDQKKFDRWDGPKLYFSKPGLRKIIEGEGSHIAFEGSSVPQAGDQVPRFVFHIHKRRPVALLNASNPDTGKTSLAEIFAHSSTQIIHLDEIVGPSLPVHFLDERNRNIHRIWNDIDGTPMAEAVIRNTIAMISGEAKSVYIEGYMPPRSAEQMRLSLLQSNFVVYPVGPGTGSESKYATTFGIVIDGSSRYLCKTASTVDFAKIEESQKTVTFFGHSTEYVNPDAAYLITSFDTTKCLSFNQSLCSPGFTYTASARVTDRVLNAVTSNDFSIGLPVDDRRLIQALPARNFSLEVAAIGDAYEKVI